MSIKHEPPAFLGTSEQKTEQIIKYITKLCDELNANNAQDELKLNQAATGWLRVLGYDGERSYIKLEDGLIKKVQKQPPGNEAKYLL